MPPSGSFTPCHKNDPQAATIKALVARIENGKNKQRLEHDGEVIPDGHDSLSTQTAGENVRHPHGEGGRATGAIEQSLLANGLRQRMHSSSSDGESPTADGCRRGFWRLAND